MPTEENKAIIRRGFEEILNQRNLDAVDTYFSPNYVGHDPALPEDLHGPGSYASSWPLSGVMVPRRGKLTSA
jgi:hypothetical protein